MEHQIDKACQMIRQAHKVYVLTGAGISTESGIPDFRSPNGGLWEKIDPMEALSTEILYNNPEKFYDVGFKILTSMKNIEPNSGHVALAELEHLGFIQGIITQNIDGLHQQAGSSKVLEVHGHIRTCTCLNCGEKVDLDVVNMKIAQNEIPPRCNLCNGVLRTDVVLFGDPLPEDFNIAWNKMKECDLLIVVGSSLMVAPVSYFPQTVSKVIIINIGDTSFDDYADIVINEKSGRVLTTLLEKLKKG